MLYKVIVLMSSLLFINMAVIGNDDPGLDCGCESLADADKCSGKDLDKAEATEAEKKTAEARKRSCSWNATSSKCEFTDREMVAKKCGGQKNTPPCEQKVSERQGSKASDPAPAGGAAPVAAPAAAQ